MSGSSSSPISRRHRQLVALSGCFGAALGFLAFATLGALGVGWVGYAMGALAVVGLACLLPMLVTAPVWMGDTAPAQETASRRDATALERASAAKSGDSDQRSRSSASPASPPMNTSTVNARERPAVEDVHDLLRERYARGELSEEQFERKLERLLETETLEASRELIDQAHADGKRGTVQSTTTDGRQRHERGSK
ncbi:SHOCT domain-containing protein [Natrialbaceae archaeon A-CW3]